jgi:hypothetical protein
MIIRRRARGNMLTHVIGKVPRRTEHIPDDI